MDNNKQNGKNPFIHPLDEPLKSSPRDFQHFQESLVWSDIKMTINDRIDILVDRLISKETDREIAMLQSEIRTLKDLLKLPEYLQECAQIEQEQRQEQKDGNQN